MGLAKVIWCAPRTVPAIYDVPQKRGVAYAFWRAKEDDGRAEGEGGRGQIYKGHHSRRLLSGDARVISCVYLDSGGASGNAWGCLLPSGGLHKERPH